MAEIPAVQVSDATRADFEQIVVERDHVGHINIHYTCRVKDAAGNALDKVARVTLENVSLNPAVIPDSVVAAAQAAIEAGEAVTG
jgi:hypothetical protein